MLILLVDDEKELVSTLAERLGYRGIDAHWAISPNDAISMLSDQSYDIAVLDVQMPDMNGFELKERLEKIRPELKFIFMTGHGSEECYHEGCSQTGEAFYLVKPVEIDSLIEKLNQVMLDGGKKLKNSVQEITEQYGPVYFGRMGASISHDIKNCLAIINENAGLMSDYLMMAQKGKPLDLERFSGIVQRIEKQISRADGIVKNLNTFSHSMDKFEQQIDLDEAIELALGLGARIIANKGIQVNHTRAVDKLYVDGSLFFLLSLIWSILENITEILASGTVLNIFSREDEKSQVCLSFQCEQPFASDFSCQISTQTLDLFQAKIVLEDEDTRADLVFG